MQNASLAAGGACAERKHLTAEVAKEGAEDATGRAAKLGNVPSVPEFFVIDESLAAVMKSRC